MLSDADTYPDWKPAENVADDLTPASSWDVTADDASAAAADAPATFGWGLAATSAPVEASAWTGFSEVITADAPSTPSFWRTASNESPVTDSTDAEPAAALLSWNTRSAATESSTPTADIWGDVPKRPAPPAAFAMENSWSALIETADVATETLTETASTDDVAHADESRWNAHDEHEVPFDETHGDQTPFDQTPFDDARSGGNHVEETQFAEADFDDAEVPFHEVAAAYAAELETPVASREVMFAPIARWGAADDDSTPLAADPNVAEPVDINRRSRFAGRRSSDRPAGPDTASKTEADTAVWSTTDELGTNVIPDPKRARLAKPAKPTKPEKPAKAEKPANAPKTPKAPKAPKAARITKEPVRVEDITGVEAPTRKAAGSGFFAKKLPTEVGEARETPKVLRIAALVSLLVGVGLFGYTVVNGRRSTPSQPAITVAPAVVTTIAPVTGSEGVPVVQPADDPIFGSPEPVAEVPADDGLAFDTAASFG